MTILFALPCILYFTFSRRAFDFYSISAFSSIVYFTPALAGYTFYMQNKEVIIFPVTSKMHAVYSLVLFTTTIAAFIYDKTSTSQIGLIKIPRSTALYLFNFISLVLWLFFAATNVQSLLLGEKENFGSLYALAFTSASTSLVASILCRSNKWIILFTLISLIDLYAGNREMIAFASIATLVLIAMQKGKVRLFLFYRALIPAIIALAILLIYKQLGAVIIARRWDLVFSKLADFDTYVIAVSRSEPFATQALLYSAIQGEWSFPNSILTNLLIVIMPLGKLFTSDIMSVPSFLNSSFGDLGYGLGSNLWAEAYVIGGEAMILAFSLAYAAIPALLNTASKKTDNINLRILIALCGVAFLFFAHRTGVEYALNIAKRYTLYILFLHLIYFSIKSTQNKTP